VAGFAKSSRTRRRESTPVTRVPDTVEPPAHTPGGRARLYCLTQQPQLSASRSAHASRRPHAHPSDPVVPPGSRSVRFLTRTRAPVLRSRPTYQSSTDSASLSPRPDPLASPCSCRTPTRPGPADQRRRPPPCSEPFVPHPSDQIQFSRGQKKPGAVSTGGFADGPLDFAKMNPPST